MPMYASRESLIEKRDTLEKTLENNKKRLDEVNKKIKVYDEHLSKFRFKEGNVAFHKVFGNVLIQQRLFSGETVCKYVIVDSKGMNRYVYDGELLPFGPATEVLYTK